MLCDAITKVGSLGPSFHNRDSWLKIEGGSLIGHDSHQEDSEGGGHVGLRGLMGLQPSTTSAPLPQCRHGNLLTSLHNHILCLVAGYLLCLTITSQSSPPIPEKIARNGLRVACCLLAGWWVTTCRAQVCQPPAAHCWPHSWGWNWSGRIWGAPLNIHPGPGCLDAQKIFLSLCVDIEGALTNGPELAQTHLHHLTLAHS